MIDTSCEERGRTGDDLRDAGERPHHRQLVLWVAAWELQQHEDRVTRKVSRLSLDSPQKRAEEVDSFN